MTVTAKTPSSRGWGPEVKAVSVIWGHPTGLPLNWPADGTEPTEEQAPYRFRLIIDLADEGTGRTLVVVGANPSTANAKDPDPTLTRLVRRAQGIFKRIIMLNLSPFRATKPRVCELLHKAKPRPAHLTTALAQNRAYAMEAMCLGDAVLFAWGQAAPKTGGADLKREMMETVTQARAAKGAVEKLPLLTLGWTGQDGKKAPEPRHPLMLSYDVGFEHYDTKLPWESGVAPRPGTPTLFERLFYDMPYPKPKRKR